MRSLSKYPNKSRVPEISNTAPVEAQSSDPFFHHRRELFHQNETSFGPKA
jgi:hypothetical protein